MIVKNIKIRYINENETSDGKRNFIINLRIIAMTTHMVDKSEKDSLL